jgi:hypothetical protein
MMLLVRLITERRRKLSRFVRKIVGEFVRSKARELICFVQLGTTQVTKEVFEEFLNQIRPRFRMQDYHLINNVQFCSFCTEFRVELLDLTPKSVRNVL